MGRAPCCSKVGLMRGPWSAMEDALLTEYIQKHGEGQWRSLPKKAGLLRCGKSCRLRWMNYLRPGIVRGNISEDEEELIVRLHGLLGNRWSLIAGRLPGRTDNEIKNYWNTYLLKKLRTAGIITSNLPKPAKNSNLVMEDNPGKDPKKKVPASKNKSLTRTTDEDVMAAPKNSRNIIEEEKGNDDGDKINRAVQVLYLPKPVRLCSSSLPRTASVDSLASAGKGGAGVSVQPPAFGLGDVSDYYYDYDGLCGDVDDFLKPLLLRGSVSDVVYDEYLQLLQNM